MDCSCGGIISLTHEIMSSEEAIKRFTNQGTIIPKDKIGMYCSHGTCSCGRLHLHFSSGNAIQKKANPILSLLKRK